MLLTRWPLVVGSELGNPGLLTPAQDTIGFHAAGLIWVLKPVRVFYPDFNDFLTNFNGLAITRSKRVWVTLTTCLFRCFL